MIITNSDFIVVEQESHRGYIQHIFKDLAQFVAWRKRHTWQKILDRTCARGRMLDVKDHRYDWEQ